MIQMLIQPTEFPSRLNLSGNSISDQSIKVIEKVYWLSNNVEQIKKKNGKKWSYEHFNCLLSVNMHEALYLFREITRALISLLILLFIFSLFRW